LSRVFLVRHAEAGYRKEWTQPDELRPLTAHGWAQAEDLARSLAGASVERLVSSPFVRCVQTLEPLASLLGTRVETSPALAEGAGGQGALALITSGPVLACTHGDVVEAALDLLAAAGVALGERPRETPKAAVWTFEVGGGSLVRAHYIPPPDM